MFRHLTLLLLLSFFPLLAEIEHVVVVWRAKNCDDSCEKLIIEKLEAAKEIESASIIPGSGQAVVKWMPNTPFSYSPLNIALRRVGPSIQLVKMVVKGSVMDDGKNIILTSTGDNTKFTLLNPVQPQDVGQPIEGTSRGRELSEELRTKFTQAEKEKQIVTVKGPLFDPFRYPLKIIVENIQITAPAKK